MTTPKQHDLAAAGNRQQQVADVLRYLRLLVSEVQGSEGDAIRLEGSSPLITMAQQLLEDASMQQATRTAVVNLRDFVWQVDMFKELVRGGASVADVIDLLDTEQMHIFLRQEAEERKDG